MAGEQDLWLNMVESSASSGRVWGEDDDEDGSQRRHCAGGLPQDCVREQEFFPIDIFCDGVNFNAGLPEPFRRLPRLLQELVGLQTRVRQLGRRILVRARQALLSYQPEAV